jgi:two-component system, cell cycle sensor histidine kinase and response regulator CckA
MNAPVRLLVVDDDPDMSVQVRYMLGSTGHDYDISALTTPAEIAEHLDAAPYDILLIDHHMSAANGSDVLRMVHSRRDAPPAIVLSMSQDPRLPDIYLELGAVDFLSKEEITPGLLDRSIRFAIAQWRSRRTIEEGQTALLKSERLATVGRLAAGVAHEYNNLNAVVLAGAELVALRVRNDPIATRHIGLVISSVERSRRISNSLLQLARTQATDPPVIDLRGQVEETANLLGPEARRWEAELVTHLPDRACPVRIDRGDLHQVIANLVINGLHAAHRTVGARVVVSLEAGGSSAHLSVADNGVGIEPQDLSRIFDPFFSRKGGHDSDGRFPVGVEGSGLGLAVSQRLIEQAGGAIAVASIPGSGTTLTITLPLAPSSGMDRPASGHERSLAITAVRLAVIEDQPALLDFITGLLSERGFTVHPYADPHRFLSDLPALQVEALLIDWRMPGMDGLQVLAKLGDAGRSRPLLVVLTSGEDLPMPEPPPGVRILGFMPKPFRISRLIELLEQA